jgi:membrane-associated phospholipid phosphatase
MNYYENKLRSADRITIAYQLLIIIIIVFNFKNIPYNFLFIIFHIFVSFFLWRLPGMGSNAFLNWMRLWNPIVFIAINFMELHYLVHNVHSQDFDQLLIQIDQWLFGVHPTIWLERITFNCLTEYLQIIYSTFYFLPIILAYMLYRRRRMVEFDYFVFIIVYGFYLSYIAYFIMPAIGPRFTLDHLQSSPLSGLYLTEKIRNILDTLENIQRDAFPSGHTEMTLLTMFYAAKYNKNYFYFLLLVGGSLIFSTVYLRYHYVIDDIAGLLLAVLVIVTGPCVYRILNDKK